MPYMRGLLIWLMLLSVCLAQERVSVSRGGIVSPNEDAWFDTPSRTVNAPPPLTAAGPLEMAEIPAIRRPMGFLLKDATGRTHGPFAFENGATVGAAAAPYLLALARDGTFTLADPRTQASFGPFAATNGAPVTVGHAVLAFARLPGRLRIQLSHRGAIGTDPWVAAGEWTPALQRALVDLRRALVDVANQLAFETAPVTIESRPTVTTPWNYRQAPTVRRSLRDRETARRAADRSATALLENFARANLGLRFSRDPEDGSHVLQPAPTGACVVCVLWRVKDADAVTAAASRTAVWWTTVATEPFTDVRLSLQEDQAGDWRGVFRLPPLRD